MDLRIVSGSSDKTIKIWNALTGQLINTLTGQYLNVQFGRFVSMH